jgi:hypothetical protein
LILQASIKAVNIHVPPEPAPDGLSTTGLCGGLQAHSCIANGADTWRYSHVGSLQTRRVSGSLGCIRYTQSYLDHSVQGGLRYLS